MSDKRWADYNKDENKLSEEDKKFLDEYGKILEKNEHNRETKYFSDKDPE